VAPATEPAGSVAGDGLERVARPHRVNVRVVVPAIERHP
jgi:hypothetical protein